MAFEKLSFFRSLLWSSVSEIETDESKKINVIEKLIRVLQQENYAVITLSDDDYDVNNNYLLYEMYSTCYQNSLGLEKYLQIEKYNKEFVENCKLGEGGFGVVYDVYNVLDHKRYAIKKVRLMESFVEEVDNTLSEIKIWANLESQFVVQYKSAWFENMQYKYDFKYGEDDSIAKSEFGKFYKLTTNRVLFIQMELCDTTLEGFINELHTELDETEMTLLTPVGAYIVFKLFLEIVEGIHYLHSCDPPLIHRDIKPSNILIKQHSNSKFIKLTDFGLTTQHNRDTMTHTSHIGTPEYIAQEVMKGRCYNEMSDMYSIGVTMSKIFFLTRERLNLFNNDATNYNLNCYGDEFSDKPYVQNIKHAIKSIARLAKENPDDRPNTADILNHTNYYSINFQELKTSKQLSEMYYDWSLNKVIKSDLIEKLFDAHLGRHYFRQTSFFDNVFKTNIEDNQVITEFHKLLILAINTCESPVEMKALIESESQQWKCVVINSTQESSEQFLKAISRHFIEYFLFFHTTNNVLVISMILTNYCMVNHILDEYNLNLNEIRSNADLLVAINVLNTVDKFDQKKFIQVMNTGLILKQLRK